MADSSNQFPIVYCRGYAGPSAQIDTTVDDPFYGFNEGATHIRVNGDGDPRFYQFEGPLLRLLDEHEYKVIVRGSQAEVLADAEPGSLDKASIWISRFYDSVATTYGPDPRPPVAAASGLLGKIEGVADKARDAFESLGHEVPAHLNANGFDIEHAATQLYELVISVLRATGAKQVYLVAHSMGGLVARCMMQKICETADANGPRQHAKDIVARFFTYATPHGGINFTGGLLNWAMETFGPAGADMFSPPKMYGYLTPGQTFGDTPADGVAWNPQEMPPEIFDVKNIFCLIGTDQKDYGFSKYVVGPQSDGLVQIQHAYIKGAHRAFVYKCHSGRYGEVNSEEGYQNLSRFLFGRWAVKVELAGLPPAPASAGVSWQADMQLAIRGLSVLMTEQTGAHYCPIQLNLEDKPGAHDTVATPIPLVETFLFSKEPPADLPATVVTDDGDAGVAAPDTEPAASALAAVSANVVAAVSADLVAAVAPPNVDGSTAAATAPGAVPGATRSAGPFSRYALSLKVYQTAVNPRSGSFNFTNNLEGVGDWSDVLIVDVGSPSGDNFGAWTGWNSTIPGAIDAQAQMSKTLQLTEANNTLVGTVDLPQAALSLPIFGADTKLQITITQRD
jgi:pimeloyl-ACP methyl ester carboxylesterase